VGGGLIDCLMVNVFVLSTVDRGLEPRSGQTKNYRICICSFFPEHAALMSKNKVLTRNQDNVSECIDMSTSRRGLLFQCAKFIKSN
jgi:hypothetical protein